MVAYNSTSGKLTRSRTQDTLSTEPSSLNTSTLGRDMILRFPNLTLLDGQPVPRVLLPVDTDRPAKPIPKAQMEQLTALPYTWPFDVQPKWADNPEMGGLGSAFLAKFFQLFDMDRNQLLSAYAPNATLAISYTTVVPPRARLAGYIHTLPNQKGLNFDKLARTDSVRNLLQRTPGTWRRSLLVANDQDKLTRWLIEDLPKTRHPLSEEGKWMYDVIGLDPVNGVGRIMLIVNGEFTECELGITIWGASVGAQSFCFCMQCHQKV